MEIDVKIDGARDLMTAKAELTEKQLNRDGFTDEDRKALKDFAFSSYTANRNIHPVMQFHHHLVRLCFFIYAGQEASEKVCVKKITVKSKDDAVFVVAHRDAEKMGLDFSRDGTPVELALTEKDGTPLDRNKYKPIYDPDKAGKDAFEHNPYLWGAACWQHLRMNMR